MKINRLNDDEEGLVDEHNLFFSVCSFNTLNTFNSITRWERQVRLHNYNKIFKTTKKKEMMTHNNNTAKLCFI